MDEEHTVLCAAIHDLLTSSSEAWDESRAKSLSRALLRRVVQGLSDAEDAAHEMCPVPDPRGGEIVTGEAWETGDVVLASDGGLWKHADARKGFVWDRLTTNGSVESRVVTYPVRPLVLLVRDGRPAGGAQ